MKKGRQDKNHEFSIDGDLPWYKVKNHLEKIQAFRVCLFTEAFLPDGLGCQRNSQSVGVDETQQSPNQIEVQISSVHNKNNTYVYTVSTCILYMYCCIIYTVKSYKIHYTYVHI